MMIRRGDSRDRLDHGRGGGGSGGGGPEGGEGHGGDEVVTVGVAAPTTAAEGTAAADAKEARLVVVAAPDAVGRLDEEAGAVIGALREAEVFANDA